MRSNHRARSRTRGGAMGWAALLLVVLLPWPAAAQAPDSGGTPRIHASRAELEALAAAAEREASAADGDAGYAERQRAMVDALRARLRDGDFQPGDRVILSVRGDSALTDTFTVRAERMLELPNLQPISLRGVLRSELQDHLSREIARFVKGADVEAQPLMMLAVIGEVTRPGYYTLTPVQRISDAIMQAGGPTREADLGRTMVRRDTTVLWNPEALRSAINRGLTLAQLDLSAGDEIVVAGQKRRNWETVLRTVSMVSGIVLGIYGASRVIR